MLRELFFYQALSHAAAKTGPRRVRYFMERATIKRSASGGGSVGTALAWVRGRPYRETPRVVEPSNLMRDLPRKRLL
jgi:hypothetical protein